MTDTEVDLETLAQRIAARGREALTQRMRAAYTDAAAAHADLISLDRERIEVMVQAATDRADGLQWRRALASVAADELGVSATEALAHPVVARAQTLLGAPSYEQGLAEMIAQPVPAPVAATPASAQPTAPEPVEAAPAAPAPTAPAAPAPADEPVAPAPAPPAPAPVAPEPAQPPTAAPEPPPTIEHHLEPEALETVEADDVMLELLPEPDPTLYSTDLYAAVPAVALPDDEDLLAPASVHQEEELQVPAIHLGGVANLPTKRDGLSLRLSAEGLDIMEGENIIGRLVWSEIEELDVPNVRGLRRQKQARARLTVRTPGGDASFEIPDMAGDELRDRVEPLIERYGQS